MAILAGITALLAGALMAGWSYFLDFEPSTARYPVRGIDASHHQGAIDWGALGQAGVHFAYMKATEGGDFRDPRFRHNWTAAARAGIARGAYHFFTFCRPGAAQARNFIAAVPVAKDALPPAIDLEYGGNCAKRPARAALIKQIRAFVDAVEKRYKVKPIFYVTKSFHDDYLKGEFTAYPFWVRSLLFTPEFGDRAWLIWQYHNRGRRDGIKGPVDLNVFKGTKAAFKRWHRTGAWQPKAGPAPVVPVHKPRAKAPAARR